MKERTVELEEKEFVSWTISVLVYRGLNSGKPPGNISCCCTFKAVVYLGELQTRKIQTRTTRVQASEASLFPCLVLVCVNRIPYKANSFLRMLFDHLKSRQVSAQGVCILSSNKPTGFWLTAHGVCIRSSWVISRQVSANGVCIWSSNKQTGYCVMVFVFDHLIRQLVVCSGCLHSIMQVSAHGVWIRSSSKQTGFCTWCLNSII
jgi:hypothetical protein